MKSVLPRVYATRSRGRQAGLQSFVFSGHLRVLDHIVPEEESIPVLGETTLYHVNVVRAGSGPRVSFDEPSIEWRAVVPVRRAPEVIVALRRQRLCCQDFSPSLIRPSASP